MLLSTRFRKLVDCNFLEDKALKISKIINTNCQIFVDDLPDIIDKIGQKAVLFNPQGSYSAKEVTSWYELENLVESRLDDL